MKRVGVVAIQGDYDRHISALMQADSSIEPVEIRVPEELSSVDSLIIPGGESTTVSLLMQRFGLGSAIQQAAKNGMPIWGTCMGMILMARKVEDSDQYTLGILDITVRRNAFGSQVHSFEDKVAVQGIEATITGVFIRAPIVVEYCPCALPIAIYQGKVVAVRQGNLLGTSFHPELTDSTLMHEWFLNFTQ